MLRERGSTAEVEEFDPIVLAGALADALAPRLVRAFEQAGKGDEPTANQVDLANRIIGLLADNADPVMPPARRLMAVHEAGAAAPERPSIPLTASDLLVNGRRELRIGSELRKELASADRVDLLCAFLRYTGVRVLENELQEFLQRVPGGLRVITTAYMSATERKALDVLADWGAELRVSYNTANTRLHAKAWLFHRESGYSTAFIGSSNLSHAALLDGLEWNVRVSAIDNATILSKFRTTFDQYWDDQEFVPYDPATDGERFDEAVSSQVRHRHALLLSAIQVHPRPHQEEILEELAAEREAGHNRNLVVAATGTGKTVVAALDYQRLVKQHGPLRLLFVAHRHEILEQSQATYRVLMRDASLGTTSQHVFASIQSLHEDKLATIEPDDFDVVVIDEFHHAEAPTYVRLLEHLTPKYLLGLTATPERMDGKDVRRWFDGRVASELRLWKALDQALLCPFQYFGVADETDLRSVKFTRGGYDRGQLAKLITGDDLRATRILQAVERYVSNPLKMKALGFCVSIAHAELMAKAFNAAGLPSAAVSANTKDAERYAALRMLRNGELVCVFAVDLFNEGVDVPNVDTVLFLRPTDSATVFLQQLGRGLRLAPDKPCLTVLDFIGNANKHYRFDMKFRAITGGTRRSVLDAVEHGFPHLPPGCEIHLDRQSQAYVIANIKSSLGAGVRGLVEELDDVAQTHGRKIELLTYLDEAQLEVRDLYSNQNRSWTDLRRRAELPWPAYRDGEEPLLRAVSRLQHFDDRERIDRIRQMLQAEVAPPPLPVETMDGRYQLMLLSIFYRRVRLAERQACLAEIWEHDAVRQEVLQLLDVQQDRLRHRSFDLGIEMPDGTPIPIRTHGTYALSEITAGFGMTPKDRVVEPQTGVYYDRNTRTDLFFVTLQKTEKEYSPATLYRDYPISPTRFHWESQNVTRADSATGRRYINHEDMGTNVVLFVRAVKSVGGITVPYLCLGKARYVSHESELPMQVIWELERAMPPGFFQEAKLAAG